MVDGAHHAVGKGLGVEAGSSLGVLIVPEANRVFAICESFLEAKSRRVSHPLVCQLQPCLGHNQQPAFISDARCT